MSGYLLDSNVVITMLRRPDGAVAARARAFADAKLHLSVVTLHEPLYGALRSRNVARGIAEVETLPFIQLDVTGDDARAAARLRTHLAARGTPVGPYDLLIAAQALTRDLTLVTHNTREFDRIPGLRLEDWEAPA